MRKKVSKDYINDVEYFDELPIYSKRIRYYLNENGMTAKDLNQKAGFTSPSVVPDLIKNTRDLSLDAAKRLCSVMNVSIDYLVGFTDVKTTNVAVQEVCDFTGLSESAVMALHMKLSLVPNENVPAKYNLALDDDGMKALSDFLSSRFAYEVFTGITSSVDMVKEIKSRQERAIAESSEKYTDEYIGKIARLCQQDFSFAKLHRFESSESMNKFIDEWLDDSISKMGFEAFPALGVILPEFAEKCINRGAHDGEHNETQK